MQLYSSFGPNPRLVRMFLAEKGIEVPIREVDLLGGENRAEPYTQKNPAGQIPSLELDDGSVLAETVVICEYLEELHPSPILIGADARQRAETRMWTRRCELNITEYMYSGFRFAEGFELFENRTRCLPEAAVGLKAKGQDGLQWLDGLMGVKPWIAGDNLSLADLVLYCCLDFCGSVGQILDPGLKNINAWFERVNQRPSATTSLTSNWQEVGMRG